MLDNTGIADIDVVVSTLIKSEDATYALFNDVNSLAAGGC